MGNVNNKGFSLLEILACITIMSILFLAFGRMMIDANSTAGRLMAAVNKASTVYLPNPAKVMALNTTCQAVDGTYFGKTTDNVTLEIFYDSKCTNELGTLNYTNNASWFVMASATDWLIFRSPSGNTLYIRTIKYSLQ